ncbi:MAG: hypothetical protein ACI9OU_000967 [Candidatus Promineifilaceae bacterium]|jgi:hypothetical protein
MMYRKIQTGPDYCPACERYIGEVTLCPYCDADTVHAPRQRRFRLLAFALILLGLAVMCLVNRLPPPGITPIGSIGETSGYRYVHLSGRVAERPYVVEREGQVRYASFVLEDETGRIRVQMDGDVAAALDAGTNLPWEGAALTVAGVLKPTPEGRIKLRVQSAEQITYLTRRVAE